MIADVVSCMCATRLRSSGDDEEQESIMMMPMNLPLWIIEEECSFVF